MRSYGQIFISVVPLPTPVCAIISIRTDAFHFMLPSAKKEVSLHTIICIIFLSLYSFSEWNRATTFDKDPSITIEIDDYSINETIFDPFYLNRVNSPYDYYSNITIPISSTFIQIGGIFALTDSVSSEASVFGVQRLEAFRYLINLINSGEYENDNPRTTISWTVIDSELLPAYAIPAALNQINEENITMVIGPNDSAETAAAADLFASKSMGLVSYSSSATLKDISDITNLLRTTPSDNDNNKALLQLIQSLKWGLIGAVFTDDIYGTTGKEFFLHAQEEGLINMTCLTVLPVSASVDIFNGIQDRLGDLSQCLSNSTANVVLIYCSVGFASTILKAITNSTENDRLTYIATAWITFVNDPKTYSNGYFELSQIKGTISVIPSVGNITAFEDYYFSLTPENNNYSFFVSFWQNQFKCFYNSSNVSLPLCSYNISERNLPISCRCTGTENLTETQVDLKIGYVWDAVLGVWYSMRSILQICNGSSPDLMSISYTDSVRERLDAACSTGNMSGRDIISVMRHSAYNGSTGLVEFLGSDRADPSFDVVQLNEYGEMTTVGYFNNGVLYYNVSLLSFKTDSIPTSYIVPDDFTFSTTTGAIMGAIAILLFIITVLCMIVIIRNLDASPIKRSSPMFLLLICAGILCLLLGVIISLLPPRSGGVCFFAIFFLLLGLGLIFGSLMAKTYRIYRIFKVIRIRKRPYSNKELVIFVVVITLIEMLCLALWIIIGGWPTPYVAYGTLSEGYYSYTVCSPLASGTAGAVIIVLIVYNIVLIIINATLAMLTRNVRSEYNESRNIGLTIAGSSIVIAISVALIVSLNNVQPFNYYTSEISAICFTAVSFVCIAFLFIPVFERLRRHSRSTMSISLMKHEQPYLREDSMFYEHSPSSLRHTFATIDSLGRSYVIDCSQTGIRAGEHSNSASCDDTLRPRSCDDTLRPRYGKII